MNTLCIQQMFTKECIKVRHNHKVNLKKLTQNSLRVGMNRSKNTSQKMKKNRKCSSKKHKRSMSLTRSSKMTSHNLRIPLMSMPMTTTIIKSCLWLRKWNKKKKSEKSSKRPNSRNNHYLNRLITIQMKNQNPNNQYSKMKIQTKLQKTKMISNQFMTIWM